MPSLINTRSGETVVPQLRVADGFWSRFVGLQFRRALQPGKGLLLVPCRAVHTFFVRFALDVIFLDRSGVVVRIDRHVQPWSIPRTHTNAHSVLEVAAGNASVELGDRLSLSADNLAPECVRETLQFLCSRTFTPAEPITRSNPSPGLFGTPR